MARFASKLCAALTVVLLTASCSSSGEKAEPTDPAGFASGTSSVELVSTRPDGNMPKPLDGAALIGATVNLEAKGDLPDEGFDLIRTLDEPLPAGRNAALAYVDERTDEWVPVPTTLSEDGKTLTARVNHLSSWGTIWWHVQNTTGGRAEAPTCDGALPSWVNHNEFFEDINGLVRWCAGSPKDDETLLQIKVANNRPYGLAIQPHGTLANIGKTQAVPPLEYALQLSFSAPVTAAKLWDLIRGTVFLPPGASLELQYTEAAVRKEGGVGGVAHGLVETERAWHWTLLGAALDLALDELGDESAVVATIAGTIQIATCTQKLGSATDLAGWSAGMYTCVTDLADQADEVTADVMKKISSKTSDATIKSAGQLIRRALMYVLAADTGLKVGELITDSQVPGPTFSVFLNTKATPIPKDGRALVEWIKKGKRTPLRFPGRYEFKSPSGNVRCGIADYGSASIHCDVEDHTWATKPFDCGEIAWVADGFEVGGGTAQQGYCTGGAYYSLSDPVLPYGSSAIVGSSGCRSDASFVACADFRNGSGFVVSKSLNKIYGSAASDGLR